jgi:hypothetical protein
MDVHVLQELNPCLIVANKIPSDSGSQTLHHLRLFPVSLFHVTALLTRRNKTAVPGGPAWRIDQPEAVGSWTEF